MLKHCQHFCLSNAGVRVAYTGTMSTITIAVIEGTTRPGRKTVPAAKLLVKVGESFKDVKIIYVDPVELDLPFDGDDPDKRDPNYAKITEQADAFFILTPEYNHSFPGSLKRLLDSEYDNYKHKVAAIAGASSGMWGGVRAVESLVPVLRKLGLVVITPNVYFQHVQDAFDEKGDPKDPAVIVVIEKVYAELIWMAKTLKYGREHIEL